MQHDLPKRLTGENFATEGLLRFLKKTFGIKKEPIKFENEALVKELLGRLTAASNEIESDFEPEPYRYNGAKNSMAVRGPISHVAEMVAQMNQWLTNSGNISEGKRYCADIKRASSELEILYKAKKATLSESELDKLLITRATALGKAIKPPRFSSLGGKSVYDWDYNSLNKPESSEAPSAKEVFEALRKVYKNYTPLSTLESKWKGGDFAGVDWDDVSWMTEGVADSDAGEMFYIQGEPERANAAPGSILTAYRDTVESILDYCVRCFDLRASSSD